MAKLTESNREQGSPFLWNINILAQKTNIKTIHDPIHYIVVLRKTFKFNNPRLKGVRSQGLWT